MLLKHFVVEEEGCYWVCLVYVFECILHSSFLWRPCKCYNCSLRQALQTQNDARLHEQLGDCLAHVSQFQDALDHFHIALRFVLVDGCFSIHVCEPPVWV